MASPLLINIAELLRRAGSIREVDRQIDASEFDFDDERIVGDSKVDVGLTLEALTDGIVVHGVLQADWRCECRRCLRPLTGRAQVEVQELYQAVLSDPDAYPITGEQLDLLEMTRENVLLAVPSLHFVASIVLAFARSAVPTCSRRHAHVRARFATSGGRH